MNYPKCNYVMAMVPHGKLHRKVYVYKDQSDDDKCVVAASWTFTHNRGQEYFVYSCPCSVSDFFKKRRDESLFHEVGKCYWPYVPVSALLPEEQEMIVEDPGDKFNINSWDEPSIVGFAFPSKSKFFETDVFISMRGDGYYAHLKVKSWQNSAFFEGKRRMKCAKCPRWSCRGCQLEYYDDCEE